MTAKPSPQLQIQQFLSFSLDPVHPALLDAHQLVEIVHTPPDQIVAIADMPTSVMGVWNWRGEVLWLVDLGQLLGFAPLFAQTHRRPHFSTMILQSQGQLLGLVVEQVGQMVWCNLDQIQSPPITTITPELAPYLRGYWLEAENTWLVLDGNAIATAFQ